MPLLIPQVDIIQYALQAIHLLHAFADLETPLAGFHQVVVMAVARQVVAQHIIKVGIKMPAGHQGRVLTFQGAARRITRIGKQRFFCRLTLGIKPLEHLPGHQYLTSYLKFRRPVIPGQHQGNGTDGLHVVGHVITTNAIATGHGTHQSALLIGERNGKAVVFHLATDVKRLAMKPLHDTVVIEILHLLPVIGIGQREHGVFVRHLDKLLVQVATHSLRGRIGIIHVGMLGLKVL